MPTKDVAVDSPPAPRHRDDIVPGQGAWEQSSNSSHSDELSNGASSPETGNSHRHSPHSGLPVSHFSSANPYIVLLSTIVFQSMEEASFTEAVDPWWKGRCEDIVISGVSVRMPQSDNMQEFSDNLMNSVDMVTEDDLRWKPGEIGSYYVSFSHAHDRILSCFRSLRSASSPRKGQEPGENGRRFLRCHTETGARHGPAAENAVGSRL